jgi:hypothetical protein
MKLQIEILLLATGLVLTGLFASCTRKLTGVYKSTCILQTYPDVVLTLKPDSTFTYDIAYLPEKVSGKWTARRDTLFLYSDHFQKGIPAPLTPKHKISDLADKDAYVVRHGKLFILEVNGVKQECYLKKER